MAFFDMPLTELERYKPERYEPDDFDVFWQVTLTETRQHDLAPEFVPVDVGLVTTDVYDVTFSGYDGQRVKGWLLLPKGRQGRLPCIVQYIGYGGGRGHPFDSLQWSAAGYAHFIMDTRGQGSVWRSGDTPDNAPVGQGPQIPGFMTRGIGSPETYYYRRVMADAVRAVEAARAFERVDPQRMIVIGGSQGGGLSLAVAGLVDDLLAALIDVPFLCHFRRATTLVDTYPYAEIRDYLKTHRQQEATVFNTLSYIDGLNFAARATTPALFSVALMDTTCPPSTVYAAYHHYAGEAQIVPYTFNDHEGGQTAHFLVQLEYLRDRFNGIVGV